VTAGRDFDFAGQTNANAQAHLGLPAAAPRKANDAAFASTLDDFWGLPPSLPPRQEVWGGECAEQGPRSTGADIVRVAPPPSAPKPPAVPQSAPFGQARTLEEVEAELRRQAQPRPDAAFQQQQQQQPQSQPQQQQHRPQGPATPTPRQPGAPLTLEEVEAEMRANAQRASAAAAPPQSQPPPQPMQQQQQQQQQQQPPQQMPASQAPPQMQQGPPQLPGFPPLGAQPPMPTGPGHFPPLGAPLDGPDFRNGAPSGLPRGMPPAAAAMHAAAERNAAARAQHMAQLRAMLDALPAPVRDIILRLPPHAQFASLEGVVAQFPGLLRPDEQEAASRPAMGVLEEIERAEMRLARRAMKIQAMVSHAAARWCRPR
jgi:DNA topoisomerase 2-associated protein PAT1